MKYFIFLFDWSRTQQQFDFFCWNNLKHTVSARFNLLKSESLRCFQISTTFKTTAKTDIKRFQEENREESKNQTVCDKCRTGKDLAGTNFNSDNSSSRLTGSLKLSLTDQNFSFFIKNWGPENHLQSGDKTFRESRVPSSAGLIALGTHFHNAFFDSSLISCNLLLTKTSNSFGSLFIRFKTVCESDQKTVREISKTFCSLIIFAKWTAKTAASSSNLGIVNFAFKGATRLLDIIMGIWNSSSDNKKLQKAMAAKACLLAYPKICNSTANNNEGFWVYLKTINLLTNLSNPKILYLATFHPIRFQFHELSALKFGILSSKDTKNLVDQTRT